MAIYRYTTPEHVIGELRTQFPRERPVPAISPPKINSLKSLRPGSTSQAGGWKAQVLNYTKRDIGGFEAGRDEFWPFRQP